MALRLVDKPTTEPYPSFDAVAYSYGRMTPYSGCLLFSGYVESPARVNLVLPEFDPTSVFAGVKTAIEVAAGLAGCSGFAPRLVAIVPDRFGQSDPPAFRSSVEATLNSMTGRSDWQFVARSELVDASFGVQDVWVATHWTTAHAIDVAARARLIDRRGVAYLIQDYEPGFLALGTDSMTADGTYDTGFLHLVNSKPVDESLVAAGHERAHQRRVFSPSFDLEALRDAARARSRQDVVRVFFYGRRSKPRNMYALGVAALRLAATQLAATGAKVEFVMAGEDGPDVDLGPTKMRNLGVLTRADYFAFLSRVDVGLSLQASPHPSHPPLELAISGAIAVTNEVDGTRSALHPGIVAVTADPDALARAIVSAAGRRRAGTYLPPRSGVLGVDVTDAVSSTWAELARRRKRATSQTPPPDLASRRALAKKILPKT